MERKVKFIGNGKQYAWNTNPEYGKVYAESELKSMYGSGWSEEIFEYLLDPDEEDSSRDFEEVFGKEQRQVNDKEPTHFNVFVWLIEEDEYVTSIEYDISLYDDMIVDAEELIVDKSHMLIQTITGHELIPYKKDRKSTRLNSSH
jgi:hypothetical protein